MNLIENNISTGTNVLLCPKELTQSTFHLHIFFLSISGAKKTNFLKKIIFCINNFKKMSWKHKLLEQWNRARFLFWLTRVIFSLCGANKWIFLFIFPILLIIFFSVEINLKKGSLGGFFWYEDPLFWKCVVKNVKKIFVEWAVDLNLIH